jgi:hypothetical protein
MERAICSTIYERLLIIGTETGLFARTNTKDRDSTLEQFVKILDLEKVTQVELLPNYDMFLILAGIYQ